MLTSENMNYILGVIAIGSVIFSIWNSVKRPQAEIELKQAVADKEISHKATVLAQKELENKAEVLAKQVIWERDVTEKRFLEVGARLEAFNSMSQKDIHAIDVRLQVFVSSQNARNEEISNSLMKIFTILEERLNPAKT